MNKLSDLTNKFTNNLDMQNIVKNVKSIITNKSMVPNSAEAGSMAEKFVVITKCLATVSELHIKQSDELAKLDDLISDLYNHLLNNNNAESCTDSKNINPQSNDSIEATNKDSKENNTEADVT